MNTDRQTMLVLKNKKKKDYIQLCHLKSVKVFDQFSSSGYFTPISHNTQSEDDWYSSSIPRSVTFSMSTPLPEHYAHRQILRVPLFRRKCHGHGAFLHSAPVSWNSLSLYVRHCQTLPSFKSQLKTPLFKASRLSQERCIM